MNSIDSQLIQACERFVYDPLGFVLWAYPWGENQLKGEEGPDKWQADFLLAYGKALKSGKPVRMARASGHGPGKTALISWLIQHFMSTRPNPEIIVTANTATQLENKTWRELAKWHGLIINKHWFEWTATKYKCLADPGTWFALAQPWSKDRPDAFQGSHEKHILFLYDEASATDDIIWETTEGAMTTPGAAWVVFGNPTQNTGRFKECWGKFRHRWDTAKIDSRTAKMADQKQIKEWIEDYGEDSDFVRVRVKGEFPRAASNQFISEELVHNAQRRENIPHLYSHSPVVIGVDVARFGDDQTVIAVRQGTYLAKVYRYREKDTMETASLTVEKIKEWNPQTVFVDVIGIGAGVVDRLRQLGYRNVIGVTSGVPANDDTLYYNLRAEMWGKMRDWLVNAVLPDDGELKTDLIGPEYGFDAKGRIQLEGKKDMKNRGLASPDVGDSLALTFAFDVYPLAGRDEMVPDTQMDFDPFAFDQNKAVM
jgi:Terminase-like family.